MGFGDFLKKLFGSADAAADDAPGEGVEYKGYTIRPAPLSQGGQFLTAGLIEKDFPEGKKSQQFIRADTHTSKDSAASHAITKGQQIIDEQGDGLFREDRPA